MLQAFITLTISYVVELARRSGFDHLASSWYIVGIVMHFLLQALVVGPLLM